MGKFSTFLSNAKTKLTSALFTVAEWFAIGVTTLVTTSIALVSAIFLPFSVCLPKETKENLGNMCGLVMKRLKSDSWQIPLLPLVLPLHATVSTFSFSEDKKAYQEAYSRAKAERYTHYVSDQKSYKPVTQKAILSPISAPIEHGLEKEESILPAFRSMQDKIGKIYSTLFSLKNQETVTKFMQDTLNSYLPLAETWEDTNEDKKMSEVSENSEKSKIVAVPEIVIDVSKEEPTQNYQKNEKQAPTPLENLSVVIDIFDSEESVQPKDKQVPEVLENLQINIDIPASKAEQSNHSEKSYVSKISKTIGSLIPTAGSWQNKVANYPDNNIKGIV